MRLADETGLLHETKFSKQLKVKANKGVGPIAMAADWQVRGALTDSALAPDLQFLKGVCNSKCF